MTGEIGRIPSGVEIFTLHGVAASSLELGLQLPCRALRNRENLMTRDLNVFLR